MKHLIGFLLMLMPAFAQESVNIRVDAASSQGSLKAVWSYFGYDEPNYTYMKDGKKLLTELAALSPVTVHVRAHNLLTSGDGKPALKWGSTNAYTEDASGKPVYDWTIVDRIFDTYIERKLERRLSAGLWFLTSYTFSKSLWTSNTAAAGGRYRFERGPSEFHVPHSFALSFGYELPFGRGKQLLSSSNMFSNALFGGWQLQGILIFRSGVPFTPTVSRDVANTGVGGQRPN